MIATSRINLHGSRYFKAKDKDGQGKRVIFDMPEGIDQTDGFISAHVKLVDVSMGQWVMSLIQQAVVSACASRNGWTVETPSSEMKEDLSKFTLEVKAGEENIFSRAEVLAIVDWPDKLSDDECVQMYVLMNPEKVVV